MKNLSNTQLKKSARKRKRTPLNRALQIIDLLQDVTYPNCTTFKKKFGVSRITGLRDIEYLRTEWELSIEFDDVKNGYYLTKPISDQQPMARLTRRELFGFCLFGKRLDQCQDAAWYPWLASTFQKILMNLDREDRRILARLDSFISSRSYGPDETDLPAIETLIDAILKERVAECDYHKLRASGGERRRLHPIHLVEYIGRWYLMAWCPRAKKIRTFVPNRMEQLELIPEKFTPPKDFDIDKHLEKSFGITTGDGDYEVVLELNEFATQVHDERQWHAQQSWEKRKDGTSTLTLRVSALEEVEMFVLGHKTNVKVKGPQMFVDRIKNSIAEMANMYA